MGKIVLDAVNFSYGKYEILKDISLSIGEGDFLCVLGPSGAGKSSLLRLIAGLASPSSGDILIDRQKVRGPGLDRGVVFQDYTLFPWLTSGENIVLALRQSYGDKKAKVLKELAREFLELVGLPEAYGKLPRELSGGMRQRVAIARVLATDPPILLMDEPFGALDAVTRANLQDLLLNLWQRENGQAKTVVFVTHDVEEALILASRIVVIGINPGSVRKVLEVDLPRPRTRSRLYSDLQFIRLREGLVELLNEEILDRLSFDQIVHPYGDKI